MKKILAILLCLAMLLCITPIVATAEGATEITNENGLSAITGSGNFILTEDIYVDLTTADLPLIADEFTGTLDGGGFSILFRNSQTKNPTNTITKTGSASILFTKCLANTIKNITIGDSEAMPTIIVKGSSGGANVGILAQQTAESTEFNNVTVYGKIESQRTGDSTPLNCGLFIGKTINQLEFINCKVIGSISATAGCKGIQFLGGFLGQFVPESANVMTLTMTGSVSKVEIKTENGGYVGYSNTYSGGLLGGINEDKLKAASDNYDVTNCISYYEPKLYSAGNSLVLNRGDLYGGIKVKDGKTSNVTLKNCVAFETPNEGFDLASGLALTTDNEASVRFNSPTGIRFYNSVSGLYGTLVRALGAENVKMGTVIAPKQLVENAGAFTKDALGALNSTTATYLDVEYRNEWYDSDEANNSYTYVGGVANILEDNYTLEYCGIGYISYNDGTGWKTIYASYDEGTGIPAFSVRALAESVTADPNATAAEKAAVAKYLAGDEQ